MTESPPIWSFDRKTEVAAVDRNAKRADHRELCYAVVDAVLSIRETGNVLDEDVRAFTKALECPNEYVFCAGGRRLVQCSHFDDKCAAQLRAMMGHANWLARRNTVAVTDYNPPDNVLLAILRAGLTDGSKRVRALAGGKVLLRARRELLPELEQCLRVEKDEAVRTELSNAVQLLRGKPVVRGGVTTTLEPDDDGRYRLVSRSESGDSYTVVSSVQRPS